MSNERSAPDSTRSRAGLFDIGFVVAVLAVIVVVALNYGDNLRDMLDGLAGFSTAGLALLVLIAVGSVFAAVVPVISRAADATSAPLEGPVVRGTARQNRALEILYGEKQRLLRAIRDMDFDYDMNKMTDAIYAEQRVHLIRQTIAVMRRIDALEAEITAQQDRVAAALAAFRGEQ